MAGEGGERLYWMHFEAEKDGAHVVPAPVLVDSVANIQRVVYLLAKFTRGEELGQRAAFSSELPLIEHRRGWVELTGDVLYDADGRALSVTHARDFVPFGQDSIELRNVNLYNVPYRASPPLRFKVKYTRSIGCTISTGSSASPCRRPPGPTCTTSYRRRCPCCGSSTARSRRTGSRRRRGACALTCASG